MRPRTPSDCIYWAVFLDEESDRLLDTRYVGDRLPNPVEDRHCTLAFRPRTVDRSAVGQDVTLTVTGYANDGNNQAVRVRLETYAHLCENEQPHITLSLGPEGKAVDSGRLTFAPTEEMTLRGRIGRYTRRGIEWE